MSKNDFAFTPEQLKYFQKEMDEVGGAHELMLQKEALHENGEMVVLSIPMGIQYYKEKHLIGIYEPLQSLFDTEIPLVFWSRVYDGALTKLEENQQ